MICLQPLLNLRQSPDDWWHPKCLKEHQLPVCWLFIGGTARWQFLTCQTLRQESVPYGNFMKYTVVILYVLSYCVLPLSIMFRYTCIPLTGFPIFCLGS